MFHSFVQNKKQQNKGGQLKYSGNPLSIFLGLIVQKRQWLLEFLAAMFRQWPLWIAVFEQKYPYHKVARLYFA